MQRKAWALLGAIGLALGAAVPALAGSQDPVELVRILIEGGSDAVIALAQQLSDIAIGAAASVGNEAFGALAMVLAGAGDLGTGLLDELAVLVLTVPGAVQGPVDLARDTSDAALGEVNAVVQQVAAEEQALGEQLTEIDQDAARLVNAEAELVPPYFERSRVRAMDALTASLTPVPDVLGRAGSVPAPTVYDVGFMFQVSGDVTTAPSWLTLDAPTPEQVAADVTAYAGRVVDHAQTVPPMAAAYAEGVVDAQTAMAQGQVDDTSATAQAAVDILTS